MSDPTPRHDLTVADIMAHFGLAKPDPVYGWIRAGLLRAVDVSASGGRPSWRISRADLEAFVRARQAVPAPAPAPRRKAARPKVTAYF